MEDETFKPLTEENALSFLRTILTRQLLAAGTPQEEIEAKVEAKVRDVTQSPDDFYKNSVAVISAVQRGINRVVICLTVNGILTEMAPEMAILKSEEFIRKGYYATFAGQKRSTI